MNSPVLPIWAQQLRDRYLSGESSLFLLHGNVRDLQPWDVGGRVEWIDMRSFLQRFLARTRDVVAYYNVSQGLMFADRPQEKLFRRIVDARRMLDGDPTLPEDLPRTPAEVLPLVELLVTDGGHSSGVVLDYFEMVAPEADPAFMTTEDKAGLVTLRRWSSEPALLATDNLILLVAERMSDVSRRLLSSPQLVAVTVPYPDEETRRRYLQEQITGVTTEMPLDALAKITAGLSLVQIRSLLQMAKQSAQPLTFALVNGRKKTIIEQECHGLVELVAPDHNLSHVGGMESVKADLMRVADAVKAGQTRRVPMGMIFVGPMGTGKSFVAEAFAAESGLTCLKFKNFRDRWVGSTEANLEKVLDLVNALGYVLLIIDEAERALSSGDNDGGVGSRVIARLKEFMSDTDHRGRVVMLMMTNRPDKLDADLKRPGRFDLKIPFFFPETVEERDAILQAQVRRARVQLAEGVSVLPVAERTAGYSAAELEAVMLAAMGNAAQAGRDVLAQEDLDAAAADVIPSRDVRMLEYMELLAVFECSAKRMLPARYQDVDTAQVLEKLDQLRSVLGRRAM